jgi:pimeloyl-ACP methyl ester carboxylesterase
MLAALVADDHTPSGTPTAVLLHGQPGEAHDWDAVVEHLVGGAGGGGGWRVVVPDRPGYGRTGGAAGGFADNAVAVVALMDRLGVERSTIVGHSWAGGVALALALAHPERVERLVLVSSVGGPGSIDRLDHLLGVPLVGPVMALGGLAVLRVSRVRRLLAPVHAPRDPTALETLPAGWLSSWRSFTVEQRALLDELPGLAARIGGIDVPAVVVTGSVDRVVSAASQRGLARLLGAVAVEVPGGGHLLPREAPDVVADAVTGA